MDIENKAQEYALNVLDECINKVKQAYIDGYNAGKAECSPTPKNITEDGVTYIDLGLPSGTMWSPLKGTNGRYIAIPYNQVKDLELPTLDDYAELLKYTKHGCNNRGDYEYLSVDGVKYIIPACISFWLKDKDSDTMVKFVNTKLHPHVRSGFIGESKCYVLVKRKK